MFKFYYFKCCAVFAVLISCCICAEGQNVKQEWLTDALHDDLKVGTGGCITTQYSFSQKFGEKTVGAQKGKKLRLYDEHGFYTKVDETTYQNTYLEDGRISVVDVFENGKLKSKIKYTYTDKGVTRVTFDSDGKEIEVWTSDGKETIEVTKKGGQLTQTKAMLNNRGKSEREFLSLSSTDGVFVSVVGKSHSISITSNYQYNDHGFLESCIVSGMGRSQSTDYSDYEYDEVGNWITRFECTDGSPEKCEKRLIYATTEDYAKVLEEEKRKEEEARRQEEERIALKLEIEKEIERNYLTNVKAWVFTPNSFYRDASYSIDKIQAEKLIEDWMQKHINNGVVVTEYATNTKNGGFFTSAKFEMDENGKMSFKSNDDADLWHDFPFKDCLPNSIHLKTLDSIASIPTKIEVQLEQSGGFVFKNVIMKFKYNKKMQVWQLKNEKDLLGLDADLKKQMLDFVVSMPFMQGANNRTVVVKYDTNADVLLSSRANNIFERIDGMTVFDVESFK